MNKHNLKNHLFEMEKLLKEISEKFVPSENFLSNLDEAKTLFMN